MSAPRVSVLLPVHQGRRFLPEALDSVLCQTFEDFELLVVDDGSSDGSGALAEERGDPRIRVLRNEERRGLVASLNRGLEHARGELVARMDADDVCLPERLARQVAFLDAHPEVGVCGTWTASTGDVEGFEQRNPTDPDDVRCELLFESALAHPTVCLRRAWFERHGLRYDPADLHAEDYGLWLRASEHFALANVGEVLLRYRIHADSISQRFTAAQLATGERLHREALRGLGIEASPRDLRVHAGLATWSTDVPDPDAAERWLLSLLRANERCGRHPEAALARAVGRRWLRVARAELANGRPAKRSFLGSPLASHVPRAEQIRLAVDTLRAMLARAVPVPLTRGGSR